MRERARRQRLWFARRTTNEITRFTTVPDDDIMLGRTDRSGRIQVHWVLRAVKGRAENFGHARVELQEITHSGGDDILDAGKHRAGIGDEEGSGLDFEMEFSSIGLGEFLESNFDGGTHDLRVGTFFRGNTRDLIAATKIQRPDTREAANERETRRRDLLPDDRITSGPDMGMDAHDLKVVLLDDGLRLIGPLMPDAKRGVRPADVGLTSATRTAAGIKAQADFMAWERLADPFQLEERAGIHVHALLKERCEIFGQLLRGE